MKSGVRASTDSWPGTKSLTTLRPLPAVARDAGSGPSRNAEPTMRSPRPRASSSSVVEDLIVTMRSGAAVTVTLVPQLSSVRGYPPATAVPVVPPAAPVLPLPVPPEAHPPSSIPTLAAAPTKNTIRRCTENLTIETPPRASRESAVLALSAVRKGRKVHFRGPVGGARVGMGRRRRGDLPPKSGLARPIRANRRSVISLRPVATPGTASLRPVATPGTASLRPVATPGTASLRPVATPGTWEPTPSAGRERIGGPAPTPGGGARRPGPGPPPRPPPRRPEATRRSPG